jgi:delta 1-pyrroline-5-carboxylate dehydrogenase
MIRTISKRKTVYYRGTPEQAMSLANDTMRKWAEVKQKAKHTNLKDAMQDLVENVSQLEDLVTNSTEQSLLDAVYEFAYIEEQLDIVRFLVDKKREQLENK